MEDSKDEPAANGLLDSTKQATKESLVVLWNELPTWLQDNHYIQRGYRPQSDSYSKSFRSIGYLHNESVNIWTHLVGALLAAVAAITMYSSIMPRFEMATAEDVVAFSCYFAGAFTCLGMSATYHTICNHSETVAKFGNRLDYVGIVFLIWGSFVPSIYYGFSAEPELIRLYWTMITTIATGTLAVVMLPKFRTAEWRPFRAFMFVAMGLSAVVPVLHGVRMFGVAQLERQMGLSWVVGQGVTYITGAAIYAARVPERWRPGEFDIWGSSHQIFHVLVVFAAGAHLIGLLKAFDYEHTYRSGVLSAYGNARKLGGP
ncbi:hypothetical protein LTR85_012057 [Meristemomyces frigidus]|nr:hypothetical protein LTR85_012057 [Meristemomyces frigidus]